VERLRVLPVENLRTLAEGKALLLYRSARPALVELAGWWDRPDAKAIRDSVHWVEKQERAGHAA
jgi:hypothetical protein